MDNFIEKSNLTYKVLPGTDHKNFKTLGLKHLRNGFINRYTKIYVYIRKSNTNVESVNHNNL